MAEQKRQRPKLRYEDRADLFETFADSVGRWSYDGNTLRIEFLVSRMDEKTGQQRTGRQIPVCRLVLSAKATLQLINQCGQLAVALQKAGVVKQTPPEQPPGKPN